MTIRQFVFCDVCNRQGFRNIEQRRSLKRDTRNGRRISDGRAWFEGDIIEAVKSNGWSITEDGVHTCPRCNGKARE